MPVFEDSCSPTYRHTSPFPLAGEASRTPRPNVGAETGFLFRRQTLTPMTALRGLAWLLVFQSVGELLARGFALPFPGPVIGMLLLLPALQFQAVQKPISSCADFLLSHLSLLFVPVGVGVMTHLSLVADYGLRILVVVVVSTFAGLTVSVLGLHALQRRRARSPPEH